MKRLLPLLLLTATTLAAPPATAPNNTPQNIDETTHAPTTPPPSPSKTPPTPRRVNVYTPPGYNTSTDKLPVLYLLHGANADEEAWEHLGRANLILDNLLAEKKCQPFICVMPFGYGN